jgi:hypothetical protein
VHVADVTKQQLDIPVWAPRHSRVEWPHVGSSREHLTVIADPFDLLIDVHGQKSRITGSVLRAKLTPSEGRPKMDPRAGTPAAVRTGRPDAGGDLP